MACDGTRERTRGQAALSLQSYIARCITAIPAHTTHTPRNTRELNKIHFSLYKRALSLARHVLEDTSHQIRPNIDAGDASLLMDSKNYTRERHRQSASSKDTGNWILCFYILFRPT
jgi:transcriptional regulatory protein LevR